MAINDDSFMNTHCSVCGGLNPDEVDYICEGCRKEQEKREDRLDILEELDK